EYLEHDATALAGLVRSGEVTAAELLEVARERATAVNPTLNAIVISMDGEADRRVAGELRGPLAGVPFLIKDLAQDFRGYPTTRGWSSAARRRPRSAGRRRSPNPSCGDRPATRGTPTSPRVVPPAAARRRSRRESPRPRARTTAGAPSASRRPVPAWWA